MVAGEEWLKSSLIIVLHMWKKARDEGTEIKQVLRTYFEILKLIEKAVVLNNLKTI